MGRVVKDFDVNKWLAEQFAIILSRPSSPPKPLGYQYPQQDFSVTKHWLWIMGREGGVFENFSKSGVNYNDVLKLPPAG